MPMASRIAVPPRESMRANPCSILCTSLVKGTSRKASSLKLTIKTSSCGFDSRTIASAAASTRVRLVDMLPLSSMMMPSETGTSSRRKIFTCCCWPFSYTLNAFWPRLVISLPRLSTTLACNTTSRVSARNCAYTHTSPSAISSAPAALLSGRIVTQPEIGSQWRQSPRLIEFHLNPAILPVALAILRRVPQDVLISKLDADLRGNVRKLGQILDRIFTPAGLLRQFVQQAGTGRFFRSPPATGKRFEDADGKNLHIGFAHCILDLCFGIPAAVVASIRDDQQSLSRVVSFLHFMHREIHAIEQRRAAFRLSKRQSALEPVRIGREGNRQLRPVVELNQEEFVGRIGRLKELGRCLARLLKLRTHAAAGVEDQADRDGRIFA